MNSSTASSSKNRVSIQELITSEQCYHKPLKFHYEHQGNKKNKIKEWDDFTPQDIAETLKHKERKKLHQTKPEDKSKQVTTAPLINRTHKSDDQLYKKCQQYTPLEQSKQSSLQVISEQQETLNNNMVGNNDGLRLPPCKVLIKEAELYDKARRRSMHF